MTGSLERSGWRATLIGTSRYAHPDLSDLPSVANNIADLAELLTAPSGGALADDHCAVVLDADRPTQVGAAISRAVNEAEDVLLVYFSGHGKLDSRGDLHLTLPDSDPDQLALSSVPISEVRQMLGRSKARARILILDCCFSGNAFEAMSSQSDIISAETTFYGTYTLVSSAKNKASLAPNGDRNTAFTAAMLNAAVDGGPTLDQLYERMDRILHGKGQPRPHQRAVDSARALRLFSPPHSAVASRVAESADTAYTQGWGGVPGDAENIVRAAQRGDVDSMVELAERFHAAKDFPHAEQWWRDAAEAGHDGAMYNLAVVCEKSRNFNDGIFWYRRAAGAGNTDAMHNLAIRLRLDGQDAEAAYWWEKAGNTSPQRDGAKPRKEVLHRPSPFGGQPKHSDQALPPELPKTRRLMLITLGKWVDGPASWDESQWGGGSYTRAGRGYYDGMPDAQLLTSARVFWKFKPENWRGIEYAVVAHAGITRAVIRIDRLIGPFDDRYGFQGQLVEDPDVLAELVGKSVPGRQNPITTWP